MTNALFRKIFPSTTEAVGETLNEILELLARNGWCDPERTFCIRLCLEEALVNAVIHGNKNEPSRQVEIEIEEDGSTCRISVRDEGDGFDPDAISMPDCSQLGGRGVCLIKEYMEDVSFNLAKNRLEMEFNRSTFQGAPT